MAEGKLGGGAAGSMGRKLTTEEFVDRSRRVHGDKFDYSRVEYLRSHRHVCIICKTHGEFWQNPSSHMKGHGCNACSTEVAAEKIVLSTDEFIERAIAVHGERYNYDSAVYRGVKHPVEIECKLHGVFSQVASTHLAGSGCRSCALFSAKEKRSLSFADFVSRSTSAHGGKYIYHESTGFHSKEKVRITCPIHGEFSQQADNHMRGRGCSECANSVKSEKKMIDPGDFFSRCNDVHIGRYAYDCSSYTGTLENIDIRCPVHGIFTQNAGHHLRGVGCPRCSNQSTGEREIARCLQSLGVEFECQAKFAGLKRCRYDFFIRSRSLLIEYDGVQHFSPVDRFGGEERLRSVKRSDERKNRWAWENGYMLMRIPYWMKDRIPELLHRQLAMFTAEAA